MLSAPSKAPVKKSRFSIMRVLLATLLVLFIFMVVGVLRALLRGPIDASRAETTSNLKQLGLALFDFEEEYGTFPSWRIYDEHPEKFPNATRGASSNDLLGMLVAGGFADNEEIFHVYHGSRSRKKTDNVFDTPKTLLEPGECEFGYVTLEDGQALSTTTASSALPLLVAPLMPGSGGADPKFNPKPFNGKAFYLRIDQAVKMAQIDKNGRAIIPGDPEHRTLFQTGPGTIWGDRTPRVHPPK
jgi:hypothetical protein